MRVGIAVWKRPFIWALGDDSAEQAFWQWVVMVVLAATVAVAVGTLTAHRIWPGEWKIVKPWPLPAQLAKDFALLGESTIARVTTVDPLVFSGRERAELFWDKAATRSDHYLYIADPWQGDIGMQFLIKNPEEVQPLAWEEHIRPSREGWQGGYAPISARVNRENWTLDVQYSFDLSGSAWFLLIAEWLFIFAGILVLYGFVIQPLHVLWAESLASGT